MSEAEAKGSEQEPPDHDSDESEAESKDAEQSDAPEQDADESEAASESESESGDGGAEVSEVSEEQIRQEVEAEVDQKTKAEIDVEREIDVLTADEVTEADEQDGGEPPVKAPIDDEDIFSGIYGYQGAKVVLRAALRNGDTHVLMIGPPGCGKSTFLMALESKLPNVIYRDSKGLKQSRLQKVLAQNPPILLIDEFDRLSMGCFDVLSVPMEHSRVTKESTHEQFDVEIDTQIIATANPTERIPDNIMSRFRVLRFTEYSEDEYFEVAEHMLVDTEEAEWIRTTDVAREVAKIAYDVSGETDPRIARDVAGLASSLTEAKQIARALHDVEANIGDVSLSPTEVENTKDDVEQIRAAQIVAQDARKAVEAGTPGSPPDSDAPDVDVEAGDVADDDDAGDDMDAESTDGLG